MTPPEQVWKVEAEQAGERLDLFLTVRLPDMSRSAIQKAIKSEQVLVNGGKTTVHRFLKTDDEVRYSPAAAVPVRNPFAEKAKKSGERKAESQKLPDVTDFIVEETDDWIVVDKPVGLLVHQDDREQEISLVDLLLTHVPEMAKVGEDPQRPGIVHRLDRDVSGLMVVAKTQKAYESLRDQFNKRMVKKTYLALTHGSLPDEEGDIKFKIARSTSKPRMAARPENAEEGKAAWTHYRVKERFRGATLVDLEILSGRTHQIRAHMHAMQCPIMGDAMYTIDRLERNVVAPRLMLQSVGLEFDDPSSGERKLFKLEPVPEFEQMSEEFRHS